MSSFSNANYPPPPQPQQLSSGSGNMMMVNGMSQQSMQSVGQQQQPQQPQQPQPIKTMQNNFPPTSKAMPSMNQFMPPTSQYTPQPVSAPVTASGPLASAQPPTSTAYGNGPQVHGMQGNLPGHLRPPTGVPLTNGGGGNSVNSSRTASPALTGSPNHFAQQQQQQQRMPVSQQNPMAPANNLSNSMQNLSMGSRPTNGPGPQMRPAPTTTTTVSSPSHFPQNFQGNFKTSALNTTPGSAFQQPPSQGQIPRGPTAQPNAYGTSSSPLIRTAMPAQPAPYPTPPAPQFATTPQNANYPPTSSAPFPNAFNQSQLNNNMVPPQMAAETQQQQQQSAPMTARRPMYPQQQKVPPPLQQQQQQPQAYPQQVYQQQPMAPQPTNGPQNPGQQGAYPSVVKQGFNSLWGHDTVDLMQNRHVLSPATLPLPKITLHNQFHESINCHPNIMRCTVTKIPESNSLLQKSRLPLGILIHPFRDVNSLPVIQCPNIVRCRLCRTYINPFVYFVDSKMWKCNLCYRVNELPDDFQFDPATKTYGDVTRRPEVRASTIEFIAPSEYMLRPPQPAIYLFLFDVSIIAQQSGYLENACNVLSKHLTDMPGDARAQVGFIAYNSEVHFYSMAEGYNQPHEMTLIDIDDPFLPRPDNLLVNLKECKDLVKDLLVQLPERFAGTHDPGSALGAALQVAYKLMQASGGRITVFQTCLPNKGPGALEAREDPNNRSAKDVAHLNPATDFYKRYALECSGYQIAVDLFLLNQQYSDLATISGISKHSGGAVHHFPLYQKTKPQHVDSFKQCFKRYLVRKIGFEAVMRIRCTRGLQVHTFHGNFFVRSTDLLSLPNVNPDAGYGMQISYEESLTDVKTICFQAALLYTNSEGERRIRVHTLCLPVTASLSEVMHSADQEAIIGLLSKMAVDRSISSNVADAREAFINVTVDILSAFKLAQNLPSGQGGLIAPRNLALLPLYILALLKHPAFRVGTSTRLDDRVFAMDECKTLPLDQLMKYIYPEFYHIDSLFYNLQNSNDTDDDDDNIADLPRLQLSAEFLDSRSIFLLDCGRLIIIYVGLNVPTNILENVFGIKSTSELPDYCYGLPTINSPESTALKRFMLKLNDDKPYPPLIQIIRDTSTAKPTFIEKLVDDRSESSLSYYEFLQHIRTQVK
ncbi:protein transport protein Sec24A [Episyrphus balteatus]|uniref:protein transport protein Sec24A n=1 Tax=Episyrphus balteatus TaxID=286459 RepID=UPI002485283B|nr:protein transport protein Sec24A [Episyrphus balteatus]